MLRNCDYRVRVSVKMLLLVTVVLGLLALLFGCDVVRPGTGSNVRDEERARDGNFVDIAQAFQELDNEEHISNNTTPPVLNGADDIAGGGVIGGPVDSDAPIIYNVQSPQPAPTEQDAAPMSELVIIIAIAAACLVAGVVFALVIRSKRRRRYVSEFERGNP